MRRGIIIILGALVLGGCGAKRRAANSHSETTTQVNTIADGKDMVSDIPEEAENFVYFPIADIEEYIATFAPIAQFEMKAYGIPASITLAQGILESGFGRGELTRKTNNHFGIKCHTGWEGEFEHHDDDARGECFRKYNHPMYSFRDHSIFLSSRSRYAALFTLRKDDYKGWARGLKAAGYATDRHYPQKLISFVEQYRLYEFDREVMNQDYVVSNNVDPAGSTQVHIVKDGDTLYSISRRYLTTVPEIMQTNKLSTTNLAIGQRLHINSGQSNK
jgi:flagellum-specific peptidoglycan hydrolase FlgJ